MNNSKYYVVGRPMRTTKTGGLLASAINGGGWTEEEAIADARENGKLGGRPSSIDLTDLHYVESVLAGRVASCVCDGELEPPQGATCRTRSGFRAWLRRAKALDK